MPPSRRDLLAAMLGLPIAFAGCSAPPPPPDGRLVGASDGLGHRLRQGPPPEPPPDAWQSVPVVIVGGGVAGLSAAWRLARANFTEFVLLELEPNLGGTSRFSTAGVVPHPWGAHYLPAPLKDNRALGVLLREMGVIEGTDGEGEPIYAEHVLCRDPHERVYHHGAWYEGLYLHAGASDEDRAHYGAFFGEVDKWVGWRDGRGRRAFALPLASASDDPEVTVLDRLTMTEWLDKRGWTSPRLRWLIDYACRDDYGTRPADTSAWAGLFYFASRRRKPGAAAQPLLTWPEGNGRLVSHLARAVPCRTNLAVADVDVPADGRGARVLALADEGRRVVGFRAEQVVFAAPHFLTPYVLRPYRGRPPAHVADFDYGSWAVANLHLRGRPAPAGVPLCWDNVLHDSPSLGYVVATHQAGRDHGPTIFTYYYPLTGPDSAAERRRMLGLGWRDWAEVALGDLERPHPDIRQFAERVEVMRWGHAMVRPRPGFVWGGSRRAAARPFRGVVHFAHSDLSGLALFEEAFDHGVRAAEDVLAARGVRSPSVR